MGPPTLKSLVAYEDERQQRIARAKAAEELESRRKRLAELAAEAEEAEKRHFEELAKAEEAEKRRLEELAKAAETERRLLESPKGLDEALEVAVEEAVVWPTQADAAPSAVAQESPPAMAAKPCMRWSSAE